MSLVNEELLEATRSGDMQCVIFALGKGADVNYKDEEGRTALMYAAYDGFDQAIVLFLASDVNMNIISDSDFTALDYACKNGQTETAKLLLDHGAKFNEAIDNKYDVDIWDYQLQAAKKMTQIYTKLGMKI